MSADVLTLPVVFDPQGPPTRRERARDRVRELTCWLLSNTVHRVPVVLMRRSEISRIEKHAFDLGRDCSRYLRR